MPRKIGSDRGSSLNLQQVSSSINRPPALTSDDQGSIHSIIAAYFYTFSQFLASTSYRQSFASRYPSSGGLCQLICRDHRVDDRSRRGIRHRRRRVLPVEAVAAVAPAAASSPVPLPGCRRHAPYRKPRCLLGVATSRGRRSMPVTRRNRGGNPVGTHPPQLPGKRSSFSRRGVSRENRIPVIEIFPSAGNMITINITRVFSCIPMKNSQRELERRERESRSRIERVNASRLKLPADSRADTRKDTRIGFTCLV